MFKDLGAIAAATGGRQVVEGLAELLPGTVKLEKGKSIPTSEIMTPTISSFGRLLSESMAMVTIGGEQIFISGAESVGAFGVEDDPPAFTAGKGTNVPVEVPHDNLPRTSTIILEIRQEDRLTTAPEGDKNTGLAVPSDFRLQVDRELEIAEREQTLSDPLLESLFPSAEEYPVLLRFSGSERTADVVTAEKATLSNEGNPLARTQAPERRANPDVVLQASSTLWVAPALLNPKEQGRSADTADVSKSVIGKQGAGPDEVGNLVVEIKGESLLDFRLQGDKEFKTIATGSEVPLPLPPTLPAGGHPAPLRFRGIEGAGTDRTGSWGTFARINSPLTLPKSPAGEANRPTLLGASSYAWVEQGLSHLGQQDGSVQIKVPLATAAGEQAWSENEVVIKQVQQAEHKWGISTADKYPLPTKEEPSSLGTAKYTSAQNKNSGGHEEIFSEGKRLPGREVSVKPVEHVVSGKNVPSPAGAAAREQELPLPANVRPAIESTTSDHLYLPKAAVKTDTAPLRENNKALSHEIFAAPGLRDLHAGAAAPVGKEQGAPLFSKGELIVQVAEQLTPALSKGSGRVTITLSPDNLGKLDMDILVRDNRVQVVLTAESRGVQQILQGHTEQLRELLQQQGLQVEGINVMLQDGRQGQGGAWGGGHAFGWESGQGASRNREKDPSPTLKSIPIARQKNRRSGKEGINIFV